VPLRFTLPAAGPARIDVFDVQGRRVATLVDGVVDAGAHDVRWTAAARAGVYLARLCTGQGERTLRVVRE